MDKPLTEEEKIKRGEIAIAITAGRELGSFNQITLRDDQITMLKAAVHEHNDSPLIYIRTVEMLKGPAS